MISLSLNELKLITKSRSFKDYKDKSEEDLTKILSEPKPKTNLSKRKIKKVKKDFSELRYGLKNLFTPEIKETEQSLLELEKSLSQLKKYYDYDDTEYQGIRDIGDLFDEIDEDYYRPIKTKSAFNANYIEYEKIKIYHLENILI